LSPQMIWPLTVLTKTMKSVIFVNKTRLDVDNIDKMRGICQICQQGKVVLVGELRGLLCVIQYNKK